LRREERREDGDREVVSGRPIDFLGYQFYKDKVLMRKSTKKRFARKMKKIKSKRRKREVMASYWGWAIHANCRNLWNTLTDNDMSFLKLGIRQRPQTKDGQKFFDVEVVRVMDILNVPITVVDFQDGITTKQGEERFCVLIEVNGQRKKFITNCFNIKDVLLQARELEQSGQKVFPVEDVVIKRKSIGNGVTAYYFEE
jgi:hypothetical protein